tara:strand:+ start:3032 stop:3199 length:168 start_codon:yes stop_codon:yes gene_type:complete
MNDIIIDRRGPSVVYVTFTRTGLTLYLDDSTLEEIITLWNAEKSYKDYTLSNKAK